MGGGSSSSTLRGRHKEPHLASGYAGYELDSQLRGVGTTEAAIITNTIFGVPYYFMVIIQMPPNPILLIKAPVEVCSATTILIYPK